MEAGEGEGGGKEGKKKAKSNSGRKGKKREEEERSASVNQYLQFLSFPVPGSAQRREKWKKERQEREGIDCPPNAAVCLCLVHNCTMPVSIKRGREERKGKGRRGTFARKGKRKRKRKERKKKA